MNQPTPSSLRPPHLTSFGTYLLDVPASLLTIPEVVLSFAERANFRPKDEFHITLMGARTIELITSEKSLAEVNDIIDDIGSWEMKPLNKFLLMGKRSQDGTTKESIIQMVDMPAFEEFYGRLAHDKIVDVPVPPPHITSFTKYDDAGIAIYSIDDYDDYLLRQIY